MSLSANVIENKMKPKISVVLATFNEQKNIGPCLKSVVGLADGIVVVDGQSTDKTVEIAKKFGARVYSTTNKLIFHINKQMAIDRAKGDWILQLDADERVTPALKKEILKTVRSPGKFNGFWIPRKNFFLGRWLKKGGQYPDPTIRLYRRGKGRLPCKTVHEQAKIEGEVGYFKNPMLHYTAPTFARYLANANRYTTLTASLMKKAKVKINLFSFLDYFFLKPWRTFLFLYFRHKGFLDGFPGFVFALFSGLHYPIAFLKYWEMKREEK